MHKSRRVKITDINPHLTCVLCSGYLIDATTIIECLHSFCRTCIVKYLESNKYCPICDVQVHKTKPLLNIRSDQTLQDIVYKLVPGLFQNEMCRRRDLYAKHPDQKPPSAEECGEVTQYSHIYTADESISLSLEYYNNNISYDNDNNTADSKMQAHPSRRFLRCPAAVSVSHLQKLIRAKYGLSTEHRVDILYMNDRLSEDFTLMDIAYIYLWRRKGPLHLTYRIFEVAKRIKLNDSPDEKSEIKTETKEEEVQNEWKEVQLQISENGIMSITNIGEAKPPETVTSNVVEIKAELNLLKTDLPELSPIQKTEKPPLEEKPPEEKEIKKEPEIQEKPVVKLGKHKLQDTSDESSAKLMKPNLPPVNTIKSVSTPVKNVQQLSRNHPLKIHSQTVTKNHISPVSNAKTVPQKVQTTNTLLTTKSINNNNNTAAKIAVSSVQKDQISAPITVQTSLPPVQNTPNLVTPKTTIQTPTSCSEKSAKTPQTCASPVVTVATTTNTVVSSNTQLSLNTNLIMPNSPKYTQAGQNINNTTTTKSDDVTTSNSLQKTPISSSSAAMSVNNCIQSSKVSIVPKKSPIKTGSYKTLRDPPKAWNPQIPRQNLTKTTVYPSNNGASTSDLNRVENRTLAKPAKFFKMRNNVPRYLGNPASGVKPMYQVREGDKSPPEVKKLPEIKKPPVLELKLNNNNKDDVKTSKPETPTENKVKIEIKTQSIIKIDPKTLKPITQEVSTPSCSDNTPEMKINQSTVPIFNPLRTQKSQTSPKIDRRSPKTSNTYLDIQNPPKSPMDRSSPKSNPGKSSNSPTSKKDKLSLNFTPPNPFIPNLTSPNLAPNQFLYPNFPSYDPRVMNNLTAYHHPFSMYYSQPRLNYPGLSAQNLPLSPNLMSSLNLEVNKNLRKNYEMSMMQLSPTMEIKKPATCVKNPREEKTTLNSEKLTDSKSFTKNNSLNKNMKSGKASPQIVEPKQESTNSSNNKEKIKTTVEPNEQKPKTKQENSNENKPKTEVTQKDKKVENIVKEKKEIVQEYVGKTKDSKEVKQVEKSKEVVQKPDEKKSEKTEKSSEAVKST